MAAAKTKNTSFAGFAQVQSSIRNLQKEGERLATRVRKDVLNLVSKDRRKAVENLLEQASKLRKDLQKRAEKTVKNLETRAEKILKRIEAQAEKSIDPVVKRFNLSTRNELEAISKRLSSLEKRVEELSTHKAA